jgi:serine/threonine protein kinase
MADREGQQLGNYRLTRLLGKGGFAEVYLGIHIYLGTEAAIKLLHTQLAGEADIEKFRREASTIARLVHPNIVRVLDFGVAEGTPYLVMDYAPKGSLRQVLPAGTPLAPQQILPYVMQMADALNYAHEQRLVHRDVKPENMLVGRNNEALLSDFGIATVSQTSSQQSTQAVAGTAAYMAPEQLQGHPRPASDQYALAVVVYEWLSGERPFQGSFTEIASQHVLAPPPPLRQKVPTLSPAIERVVLTALAKDPKDRFPDVRAFAAAFEQASKAVESTFSSYNTQPVPPPASAMPPQGEQMSRIGPQRSMFDAPTHITPGNPTVPTNQGMPPGGPRATRTPPDAPQYSLGQPPGAPLSSGQWGGPPPVTPTPTHRQSGWGAPGGWAGQPAGGQAGWDQPTSATAYEDIEGGRYDRYEGWGGPPNRPAPPYQGGRGPSGPPPGPRRAAPAPGAAPDRRRTLLIALVAALLLIVLVSGSLAAFGAAAGDGPLGFLHGGSASTGGQGGTTNGGGGNGGSNSGSGSTSTVTTTPTGTETATVTATPTATSSPTPTSTPFTPSYSLDGHSNSAVVPNGSSVSVTATCASGEQLVGGGYYVKDTNELYNAESSYPSASNAWTASITNNTAQTMTLYSFAMCLQANFSLGIQIKSGTVNIASGATQLALAGCTGGGYVTGGGFKTTPANKGFVTISAPTSSPGGWEASVDASFGAMTATAYALCAAQNATSTWVNANFGVPISSAAQQTVGCSPGQLLTGGGYQNADSGANGNVLYYLDEPATDYSVWYAGAYNRDSASAHSAQVWAICVTITA